MEFLTPAALYSLFLLPLLLVPYLLRERPRRVVFSSILFLKDLAARPAARPWGRLFLPPIFFLQLLLLLLLVLALAEPVFSVRPVKIAAVIDNSASMQALAGDRSRFETAREEARAWVGRLPPRSEVDVYRTVPALERVGEKGLSPTRAAAVIDSLVAYDLGDSRRDYGGELVRLIASETYEQLLFWTDRPAAGTNRTIDVVSVARSGANLALTSLDLARRSFVSAQWSATATVANYSSAERRITIGLKGGGELLSSRAVTVPPGRSARVTFEELPPRGYYEAEIQPGDSLPLDNRRFAVPPASGQLRILGISPRPDALTSLRSIPGLTIDVISPDAYSRSRTAGHHLEIFHYSAPALLPDTPALFILPPEDNPIVAAGKPLSQPVISAWREPHRLTRYVNFTLLRPGYARVLTPRSFGEAVLESPEGPLAIAMDRGGLRYLALGFDPFPYLGGKNLPVSILTLNLLEWFQEGPGKTGAPTGEPIRFPPRAAAAVRTPAGEELPVEPGSDLFSRTFFQGIYQLRRDGMSELRAVNFDDAGESDLGRPPRIQLREEPGTAGDRWSFMPLWPYLLVFALFLLLVEWFWNPPVRSGPRVRAERKATAGSA